MLIIGPIIFMFNRLLKEIRVQNSNFRIQKGRVFGFLFYRCFFKVDFFKT